MLEAKIDTLTEAVKELTATIKANGVRPAAAKGETVSKGDTSTETKPKHTLDEMKKKCMEVRDAFDATVIKSMITDVGKAARMGDVTGANIDALYDACVAKLQTKGSDDDL